MLRLFARYRVLSLVSVTVLAFLLIGVTAPGFLSVTTLRSVVINGLVLACVTSGATLVILTRSIDVSVGSILGLSAAVMGVLLERGLSLWPAIGAALLTGALAGLFNGVLVALVRVPSIIATLGTLGLFRGLLLIITGGRWIENLPESLKALAAPGWFGLPPVVLVVLLVLLALHFGLSRSQTGRYIYAVGDNHEAAHHLGLPVRRLQLAVFVAAGLLAGLGGVIFAAQIGFIPGQAGNGLELKAIAACVLGGVSLLGGAGTIAGIAVSVFFLTAIDSALVFLKIPAYWNDCIAGAILLAVLLLDGRLRIAVERSIRARRYAGQHQRSAITSFADKVAP